LRSDDLVSGYFWGWLRSISRVAFAVTFLLVMMTPSWTAGTFAQLPIWAFERGGQHFQIGVLVLFPLLAGGTWMLSKLHGSSRAAWLWGPPHVAVPVLGFGTLVLVRVWPIHVPHIALIVIVSIVLFLGIYFYVLQNCPAALCVALIAALLFVQGGIAILQFLKQGSLGLHWMGEGWLDPQGQGISVIEAGGRRWLRSYGMMPHPNVLGGYLSMCILICLGAAYAVPGRDRKWLWGAIVVGGLGLFFTFSRSAWLGTAIGLGYMLAIARPWRDIDWRSRQVKQRMATGGVVLLLLVVGGVVLYGDLLITRFFRLGNPLEATSIQERIVDIRQAWGLIDDVPFKGTGPGYYIAALWAGVGRDRPPGFRKVHNTPLLAAAELGVGGAILWLWMLCAPPAFLARHRHRAGVSRCVGWAGAFVSAFVLGLFDSYLYVPGTWWPAVFLGLAAGAWAQLSRKTQ
jgi:hypothetical protein